MSKSPAPTSGFPLNSSHLGVAQHRFRLAAQSQELSPISVHQSVAGPSTAPPPPPLPSNGQVTVKEAAEQATGGSTRNRTHEEDEITRQTAARFAACLAADHIATLYPDVDTPFIDATDVVHRLLPYHIYQYPREDLYALIKSGRQSKKGKGRASDMAEEIAETKFALECHKRYRALETRFRRTKTKVGTRSAPDSQSHLLAQLVLESDRADTTALSTELRNARSELDRMEREKRLASLPPRPAYYTAPTTPLTQYYRTYPYAYNPYATNAAAYTSSSPTTTTNPSANSNSPTAPNPYAPAPTGAIPVQLPVASLPALHQLGIVPVPVAALPPADQAQPPAVLRGSTSGGTMLSLEINVGLLQSAQMNGLALILNSLMARGVAPSGGTGAVSHPGYANGSAGTSANGGTPGPAG